MPSAWTQNFYHTVFSTKQRADLITPELETRLYPFLGGILRDLRCTLVAINGMPDHMPRHAGADSIPRGPVALRDAAADQGAIIEVDP